MMMSGKGKGKGGMPVDDDDQVMGDDAVIDDSVTDDLIRAHLGEFLRTVVQLRDEPDHRVVRAALKKLRRKAKKDEALASGYVENAIREGLITGNMASSFINDAALAMSIHKHLIKAGKIISTLAREQVVVDDSELPEEESLSASERREIDAMLARAKETMDARVQGYRSAK